MKKSIRISLFLVFFVGVFVGFTVRQLTFSDFSYSRDFQSKKRYENNTVTNTVTNAVTNGLTIKTTTSFSSKKRPENVLSKENNKMMADYYRGNFLSKTVKDPNLQWIKEEKISKINWTFDSVWSEEEDFQLMFRRSLLARETCEKLGRTNFSRKYKV